ncbi:FMRFamide receptor-like [Gigantopelta aegis]|uniref:FMRFamide receptor-like n=1 Tax=Gigantopelta aegis TaxID=1735272 RepID=UPI001B88B641|nr:FMRFamide receptor-like [Gigantopelta aegis]
MDSPIEVTLPLELPPPEFMNITFPLGLIPESDGYEQFYLRARFITGLIFYPVVCLIGLIGNILSIIVMCQKQMTSSTNVYLLALAISDCIKIISDFLYFTVILLLEVDFPKGNKAFGFLYPYAHYIFNTSLCISAWLTVSVAVERYIYVCHPTKVKGYCTISRARTISTSVFVLMSFLAIPYAMRYRTIEHRNNVTGAIHYIPQVTDLWQNQMFSKTYTWLQNFLRSIIPLFLLIVLNTCIIYGIRRCRFGRFKSNRRYRITIMLVFVILVFLVFITPDAIMSTFFGFGYYEEKFLHRGVREITDLLLLVNSGTNFIIYCIFNTIFWRSFVFLFCRPCCSRTDEGSQIRRFSLPSRAVVVSIRKSGNRHELYATV